MLDSDTAILDSNTLLSSLRFTQKHSHSILTLTQTNSIWLKLIHSHLTWWWKPSWTASWIVLIQPSYFILSTHTCQDWIPPMHKENFTILNSAIILIHPFCTKKIFTHSFWLNLMMAAHLEFCPSLDSAILHKKNFTHSFWLNFHDGSPSWTLPCWIQTPCYLLSYSLKNTLTPFWLWLKLINLINLKMATILNGAILNSSI